MNLTEHFTLEEFTTSEVALRKGLDNTPTPEVMANLALLAETMEKVRAVVNCAIHVNSAYRSAKVNAAVGGATNPPSAHVTGEACDFTAPEFGSPKAVALAIIAAGIEFDQLIWEGTWVHLSIKESMRGQVLTAHFGNGKVTYTQGIA